MNEAVLTASWTQYDCSGVSNGYTSIVKGDESASARNSIGSGQLVTA
jgi:hypothetical protein